MILHILTGCTAVGKTEWGLRWAEERNAEIVSCDSLQFYRGMDIGTAKPTAPERARVPHHLIDCCEVSEPMNSARYAIMARAAAEAIHARGREILAVGGSGFYLKSFFGPISDSPEASDAVRCRVRNLLECEGLSAAVSALLALNPEGLGPIDLANPRRVQRALERCLASGRTLAQLAADFGRAPAPFADWDVRVTVVDRPAEEVSRRIDGRVAQMLESGLVREVEGLLGKGLLLNPSGARAIGYREVIDHLQGRLRADELPAAIARNTRALAKKQRTWFRTQLPPHRVVDASAAGLPGGLFD